MASATTPVSEPALAGQTVVVIGGSAGIGLETARRARAEGADVILTGRNPDRLSQAELEIGARRTAAFDATDPPSVARFFHDLPEPIDHVMVTAGRPRYGPLLEMDAAQVRDALGDHVVIALEVARGAAGKMRAGGRRPTTLTAGSSSFRRDIARGGPVAEQFAGTGGRRVVVRAHRNVHRAASPAKREIVVCATVVMTLFAR